MRNPLYSIRSDSLVDPERSSIPELSDIYDTDSEFGDAEEDSDDDGKLPFQNSTESNQTMLFKISIQQDML